MFSSVCVVCTGNICRSPMGEALLRERAPQGVTRVFSAGISALVDYPAEPEAVALLAEHGIDLSAHRAQQVTEETVGAADLLLAMDDSHLRWLHRRYPQARGRAYKWLHWNGGGEVLDPYGMPRAAFEQALHQIETGLSGWLERLA